jgi:hypothetical protein
MDYLTPKRRIELDKLIKSSMCGELTAEKPTATKQWYVLIRYSEDGFTFNNTTSFDWSKFTWDSFAFAGFSKTPGKYMGVFVTDTPSQGDVFNNYTWKQIEGEQGIQGVKGDKGDTGSQGLKGDTGAQGIQGEQGLQGVKGDTGSQGIQGIQGVAGYTPVKGIDYFDGAQGIQGIQGERGLQGIQGIKGDTGQQGIQGIKGDKGDQGIQGERGLQGEQGLPGSDATVTQTSIENALGYTPANPSAIPTQMVLSGDTLPTPSSIYRGKIFTLLGATDIADKHYICGKNADNTYSWKPITGFSW